MYIRMCLLQAGKVMLLMLLPLLFKDLDVLMRLRIVVAGGVTGVQGIMLIALQGVSISR
jgi:hypothetical protein